MCLSAGASAVPSTTARYEPKLVLIESDEQHCSGHTAATDEPLHVNTQFSPSHSVQFPNHLSVITVPQQGYFLTFYVCANSKCQGCHTTHNYSTRTIIHMYPMIPIFKICPPCSMHLLDRKENQ